MTPEDFIHRLKRIYGLHSDYRGGCLKLALILISFYGGEIFENQDHVITKIGDSFYDHTGKTGFSNYTPLTELNWETITNQFAEYLTDSEINQLTNYYDNSRTT